ncbi:MAG: aminopeptidase P family protein [Alphaproteobacteria bacterium]|nr:aminopeptidase P family protein [Alphaproteobacteria bacterium]
MTNLETLRAAMISRGLDGYLLPRTDEYQGEYVPACAERLAWLTGFTGSAGIAVVLSNKAVVMSDGRYEIQLAQEVDPTLFETADMFETPAAAWIQKNAPSGTKIGYDPLLFTPADLTPFANVPVEMVPLDRNLVDDIWTDRPAPPCAPVSLFPEAIAGLTAAEKREMAAATVREAAGTAFLLADPLSIMWLLNVRGGGIPYIPVALSRAVLHADGAVDWFVESQKLTPAVRESLGAAVAAREPDMLFNYLKTLGTESCLLFDPKRTPVRFLQIADKAGLRTKEAEDPCVLPRAIKTPAEQTAIREAHIRDGVAMVRFLHWIATEAPKGHLTELDLVAKRESFSRDDPAWREPSFDTIAGWAENGAIIHYRVTPETNKRILPPGLLLMDSGGQYCGEGVAGTTDITRTVAIGRPTDDMRENFTRVLQGHIAVASARFPASATGPQIDALARKSLWEAGRDYDHGTGHGVGCYLSVHEDAAGITRREIMPFAPGMLLSNEPGFYKKGAYGIRIESLVQLRKDGKREDTETDMLAFDTVTLAPIDRSLIVKEMLSASELAWLNAYHARVCDILSPRLDAASRLWLAGACAPIS